MTPEPTESVDILAAVLNYIEQHHGNLRRLANEAGVSYDWLCSVRQGRRKDPRLSSIQKILDHQRCTHPVQVTREKRCAGASASSRQSNRVTLG